jgi:hypothetical protein
MCVRPWVAENDTPPLDGAANATPCPASGVAYPTAWTTGCCAVRPGALAPSIASLREKRVA